LPARAEVPLPEVPHGGYLVLYQTKLSQVSESFNLFLPLERYQTQELAVNFALLITSAFILFEEAFNSIEIDISDSCEDRAPQEDTREEAFWKDRKDQIQSAKGNTGLLFK
jgi:hypothetical protein